MTNSVVPIAKPAEGERGDRHDDPAGCWAEYGTGSVTSLEATDDPIHSSRPSVPDSLL